MDESPENSHHPCPWNNNRAALVITKSAEGAFASQDGHKVMHSPAFHTEVVDTKGCGDCFHGVYSATLALGFPLEKRVSRAGAAASLKARVIGAPKGAPTRDAVEKLLRQNPKL